MLKPLLKWAGGKRWLVPIIQKLYKGHEHRCFVEPFCGGMAVTLGLLPKHAILNDVNPHLINFYRWVGKGLEFTIEMRNDLDLYYAHRRRFNELIRQGQADTAEAAQLFFYLIRTGYNGLCRFNRQGEFNVPFGKYKHINYEMDLERYRTFFNEWRFYSGDFGELELESNSFIYADPPYDVEFRQYSKEGFSWDDQVRMAEWLARHPGPVIASNQATPRIVELYTKLGFRIEYVRAPRMISCTGDRSSALEILALKGLDDSRMQG